MQRAIHKDNRLICVPVHVSERMWGMTKASDNLAMTLGREGTDDEIAEWLGVTVRRVRYDCDMIRQALGVQPVSLESLQTDSDKPNPITIEDKNAERPEDEAIKRERRAVVLELLKCLEARERLIIDRRFGFSSGAPQSLEEIGVVLGVSRERVRQIERGALVKLRLKKYKVKEWAGC